MSSSEFEIAAEDSGPRASGRLSRTGAAIRDFLLRGGRLTKVAGAVASYAPSVGRSAPLAGTSALALGIGFGGAALTALTAGQALAQCTDTGTVNYCTGTISNGISTDGDIVLGPNATVTGSVTGIEMTKFAGTNTRSQRLTQSGTGAIAGGRYGIRHSEPNRNYSGGVHIHVRGTVTGTAQDGDGIRVKKGPYGGNVHITAADVTGGRHGININADSRDNQRWTSVTWTGTVTGQGGDGFRFSANDSGFRSGITVTAANATGTRHGIYIRNGNSSGERGVSMTVTGRVTGGAGSGRSAIRVRLLNDNDFKLDLNSGAVVGTGGEGNAVSTVGGGKLTATVNSGATIHGGIAVSTSKSRDALTFKSSSTGTLTAVRGLDTLTIESGATVSVGGTGTDINKVTLNTGGTLSISDGSTVGSFTVGGGNFTGGGTIVLDANFGGATPNADKLYINGDVSGTTTLDINAIGSGATGEFLVVHVGRLDSNNNFTVNANSFAVGDDYTLRFDATNKTFYAEAEAAAPSVCTGDPIVCSTAATATLSTDKNITLLSGASFAVTGSSTAAIEMTKFQTSPFGNFPAQTLTQSATGAGAITGGGYGIRHHDASNNYGGVTIDVKGHVTGTEQDGIRIRKGQGANPVIIKAVNVTGGRHGIHVEADSRKKRNSYLRTSITSTGTVTGQGGDGIYFRNHKDANNRLAGVTITAANVSGTRHGINIVTKNNSNASNNRNVADVSVTVTGIVTGGASGAAIRVWQNDTYQKFATIDIAAGAVVGTGGEAHAIQAHKGILRATVHGTVHGKLTASTGANGDEVTFKSGATGTLAAMVGIDTMRIESGATVSVDGSATEVIALTLGGTLNLHNNRTIGSFTVGRVNNNDGNLTGGGAVTLGVDMSGSTPKADWLVIRGSVSGTTTLNIRPFGSGATGRFLVAEVFGDSNGSLSSSSFVGGGGVDVTYEAATKKFFINPNVPCEETSSGSGVFTCGGLSTQEQTLSASGSTALSVTLSQTGSASTGSGRAFDLTSSAGISFNQSGSGAIRGSAGAIRAVNSSAGSVSISAQGTVTADSGPGIEATNSASGDLTVTASGAITATGEGIKAQNDSGGNLSISAGSVSSSRSNGIYAKNDASGGSITITAGDVAATLSQPTPRNSVKGDGIHAKNFGTGSLVISARSVSASASSPHYAIGVNAESSGADLTISLGDVSGAAGAVRAVNKGTGATTVTVTGSARQTESYNGSFTGVHVTSGDRGGARGGDITIRLLKKQGAPDDAISIENHRNSSNPALFVKNYGTGSTSVLIEGGLNHPGSSRNVSYIYGSVTSGDISVTAKGKVEGGDGLRIDHMGDGGVTVSVGDVIGRSNTVPNQPAGAFYARAGVYVKTSGTIVVAATGHVDREGTGRRQGIDNWRPQNSAAAVHTRSVAGKKVTITLNSGAYLDGDRIVRGTAAIYHSGLAIRDEAGDATVTVNSGATATGKIVLGSGADTLIVNSGATVTSSGTMERQDLRNLGGIDFGDGDDRLTVNAGATVTVQPGDSAHPAHIVLGAGNDEVTLNSGATLTGSVLLGSGSDIVTVESGATVTGSVALGDGDDTLRLRSGAAISGMLEGGAGNDTLAMATRTLTGASLSNIEAVSLANNSAGDVLTVTGTLNLGASGSVALDANFSSREVDKVIADGITGTVTINLSQLSSSVSRNANPLTLFEIRNGGNVSLDNFVSGSDRFLLSGRTESNVFYVDVAYNPGECEIASDGSYSCTGPFRMGRAFEPANAGAPLVVNFFLGGVSDNRQGKGAADLKSTGGIAFASLDSSATFSGRAFGIRAVNDGTGAASIQIAGAVSAADADSVGIDASNAADGVGLSVSAASVTGGMRGIKAIGSGAGDVRVTATGTVTAIGTGGVGIDAKVEAAGMDLIVSAATVTGSATGIMATSSGSGRVAVTATGAVSAVGANSVGIDASNSASGAGLSVSAASVAGGMRGIKAIGSGVGGVRVTATGKVSATAANAIGIEAISNSGTDLVVSAATVTGSAKGIEATSSGSGDVAVTATGAVSATASNAIGIRAVNNSGADLTVAAATVTGSAAGIEATSSGSGDVAVTATGAVSATASNAIGIRAVNNSGADLTVAAATVTGSAKGIEATSSGSGVVAVTATGEVSAASASGAVGIEAINSSGTNLTIAAATVTGSAAGIRATSSGSGRVAVAATGDVVATDGAGTAIHAVIGTGGTDLTVTAAAARGGKAGIRAVGSGSGSVSIAATGEVSGSDAEAVGIDATVGSRGTGLTVSAASVRGPATGIRAVGSGSGAVNVTATGAVIATGTGGIGIDANVGTAGTDLAVSSSDRVRGGEYGVKAIGSGTGAVSVTTTGDVVASGESGVHAVNSAAGSSLSISVANVEGNTRGVYAKNEGRGALRISTRGRVSGGNDGGAASTDQAAIFAKSSGTATSVDVRGAVESISGSGIHVAGPGAAAVDIAPAASVKAAKRGVSVTSSGDGDVRIAALGTVTSDDDAIFASDSGRGGLSVAVHGSVTGANSGISAMGDGTQGTRILVSESGEVTGNGVGDAHAGIKVTNLSGPGSVIVEGAVTAMSDAIRLVHGEDNSAAGDLTVELRERANVSAGKRGVVAESHGRGRTLVSVNGVVKTTAGHGVEARDREASGGLSVAVGRSGVLTVSGSGADGVYARGKGRQGVSVDIRGDIAAQGARHGVHARADSAVAGISVAARGIVAGGTAADQAGIRTESQPGAVVDVALGAGAIVSGRNAIEDGPGDATVTMRSGSRFAGNVKLGDGDDRLVIDRARYGTDTQATATEFLSDFLDSGMVLDGGAGSDTLEIRGEQLDAERMNGLVGANGAARGWETFAIGAGGVLDLSGDRDSSLDDWLKDNRLESGPGGAVSLQNGKADDSVRVGNFVGGGRLWMDADLSGDGAVDRLEIAHGGSVSGITEIVLSSAPRSAGQDTEIESQVMVVVEGDAKTDPGAFRLERNSAAFGAFSYQLDYRRNRTAENHEFVLGANNRVSDTGAILESTPDVLARGFGRVPSLVARSMAAGGAATLGQALRIFFQDPGSRNGWVRASSGKTDHGLSPNGGTSESKSTNFDMGLDLGVDDSGAGTWVYGMTASYGTVNAEATGATGGIGSLDASGLGAGAVATWVGVNGAYLDAHARYTRISTDYTSSSAGEFASGNSMGATVASVEVGRSFEFGGMVLVPQGQVSLTRTGGGEFTTTNGVDVILGADSRLVSRLGVAAEFALDAFGDGGTASLTGTFEQASAGTREISFDGQALQSGSSSPKMEVGFGVSTMMNGVGLYADGVYRFSLESGVETEKGASLSGGVKWSW